MISIYIIKLKLLTGTRRLKCMKTSCINRQTVEMQGIYAKETIHEICRAEKCQFLVYLLISNQNYTVGREVLYMWNDSLINNSSRRGGGEFILGNSTSYHTNKEYKLIVKKLVYKVILETSRINISKRHFFYNARRGGVYCWCTPLLC